MSEKKIKELKSFGLIFASIFFVMGIIPLIHKEPLKLPLIALSILFFAVSVTKPSLLANFHKVWMKFGDFTGGIMSRIIMVILFYTVFTPISFVLKLLRKDLLNKRMDKNAETYWIDRQVQPVSLRNQF